MLCHAGLTARLWSRAHAQHIGRRAPQPPRPRSLDQKCSRAIDLRTLEHTITDMAHTKGHCTWKIRPATKQDVPSIVWLTQVRVELYLHPYMYIHTIFAAQLLAEFNNDPNSRKIGGKGKYKHWNVTKVLHNNCHNFDAAALKFFTRSSIYMYLYMTWDAHFI